MNRDDLYQDTQIAPSANADPWATAKWVQSFNHDLMRDLRRGPSSDFSDLEVALLLCTLLQSEFTAFGTDGTASLAEAEAEAAVLALQATTRRLAVEFSLPFRNLTGSARTGSTKAPRVLAAGRCAGRWSRSSSSLPTSSCCA